MNKKKVQNNFSFTLFCNIGGIDIQSISNTCSKMQLYNFKFQKYVIKTYYFFFYRNMEEVARFMGMKQHKQLTYAAKQLISREVCTLYTLYTCRFTCKCEMGPKEILNGFNIND